MFRKILTTQNPPSAVKKAFPSSESGSALSLYDRRKHLFNYPFNPAKVRTAYDTSVLYPVIDAVAAELAMSKMGTTLIDLPATTADESAGGGTTDKTRAMIEGALDASRNEIQRAFLNALKYGNAYITAIADSAGDLDRFVCYTVDEVAVGGRDNGGVPERDGLVYGYGTRQPNRAFVDINPAGGDVDPQTGDYTGISRDVENLTYHLKTNLDPDQGIYGKPFRAALALSEKLNRALDYLDKNFYNGFRKGLILKGHGKVWEATGRDDQGEEVDDAKVPLRDALAMQLNERNIGGFVVGLPHAEQGRYQADDLDALELDVMQDLEQVIGYIMMLINLMLAVRTFPKAYLGWEGKSSLGSTTEVKELVGIFARSVVGKLQKEMAVGLNRFIDIFYPGAPVRVVFEPLDTRDLETLTKAITDLVKANLLTYGEGYERLPFSGLDKHDYAENYAFEVDPNTQQDGDTTDPQVTKAALTIADMALEVARIKGDNG